MKQIWPDKPDRGMTSHELARYLLEHTPDVFVIVNGWGSGEGTADYVTGASVPKDVDGVVSIALAGGYVDRDGKWIDWSLREDRVGGELETGDQQCP